LTPSKSTTAPQTGLGGTSLSTAGVPTSATTSQSGAASGANLSTSVSTTGSSMIKSQSVKDQPLPQPLMDAVENFKY
jgi:hypothetical protein